MTTQIEIKREYYYLYKSQQVLAMVLLCNIVVLILMSVCLMSSYWITADGFRQGIFFLCIEEPDPNSRTKDEPLPFDLNKDGELLPGCYPNRNVGYLRLCTCLCVFTQSAALASACFIGLAIRFRGLKKIKSLKLAITTTLVIIICDIALLIIYPTQFAKEIDKSNRDFWELNSAYGLACGAAILALGSLISLLTVFYRISRNYYEATPTRI